MQLENSTPETVLSQLTVEQLVARVYSGDMQAETEFKRRVWKIVKRYPPVDYTLEGEWNRTAVADICGNVWEKMLERGLNRFWYLAGANEQRIRTSLQNFVYNVMLSTATPEQRLFINTVVHCFNHDKQFSKKKVSRHSRLMGLTEWKENKGIPVCNNNQVELLQLWKEKIKWPDMATTNVKRPERVLLFKQMLKTILAWVLDAHFYNNYRHLINFPKPGHAINVYDQNDQFVNLDKLLTPAVRDRTNIDEFELSARLIKENHTEWKKQIKDVFGKFDEDQLAFLYYWCIVGLNQTSAARKIKKKPKFATLTKQALRDSFVELKKSLDPTEIPAMSRFFATNLRSMLESEEE